MNNISSTTQHNLQLNSEITEYACTCMHGHYLQGQLYDIGAWENFLYYSAMPNCLEFKYVYNYDVYIILQDKEIPTDNSIALDSNGKADCVCVRAILILSYYSEKKETNDDIESWFLTPQNVVDPAVGSTGIIMSQVITTPKGKEQCIDFIIIMFIAVRNCSDGPRSRKNREFQSSNDNLKVCAFVLVFAQPECNMPYIALEQYYNARGHYVIQCNIWHVARGRRQ